MSMAWVLPLHRLLVSLLIVGFVWRLSYAWHGRAIPYAWLRRGVPDVVDMLVLLTGVTMAFAWHIEPWQTPWFAWKLGCVVLYIAAGFVCFSTRYSLQVRRISGVWAMVLLCTIVCLVLSK